MPRFNQRLIAGLDAAAGRTGIPTLAMTGPRRRRFRWLPILMLLLAFGIAGYCLFDTTRIALASALIVVIQSVCFMFQYAGPLRTGATRGEIVDEFDRELRLRAYLAGFACATALALIGIFGAAGLTLILRWQPLQMVETIVLVPLLMLVVISTVPTLYASWAIPAED